MLRVAAALVIAVMAFTPAASLAADFNDPGLAEAIRFRSEQGFATDLQLVKGLLSSSEPRAERFGTPLTAAEEALMVRRGDIQEALQPMRDYAAAFEADLAGIWLSYPPGASVDRALTVNVNVARNSALHEEKLTTLTPVGASLEVHDVRFSRQELNTIKIALRQDRLAFEKSVGAKLQMTATNVPENHVDLYVEPLTPTVSAAIEARYPAGAVAVSTVSGSGLDVCTRTNCGPPWTGGVKIRNSTGGNFCTLGFVVRKTLGTGYAYGVWTAGHCGSATYRQGSSTGAVIGTTSINNASAQFADIQLIPITSTNRTNKIIDDTATCANPCTRRVFTGSAQQAFNGDDFNDTVCNNGYATGRTCGLIKDTDLDNFMYAGLTLQNQRRATYARNLGDSGGPVYTTKGSAAAGSHVHYVDIGSPAVRYPVYSHVFEMSTETGYFVYNGS